MKKNQNLKYLIFYLLICSFTCCNNKEIQFKTYYEKSKDIIGHNDLHRLKMKKDNELIDFIIYDLNARLYKDSLLHEIYDNQLDSLIDYVNVDVDEKYKIVTFFIMFHYHLNDEEVSYDIIKMMIKNYEETIKNEEIKKQIHNTKESKQIFEDYEVGDTICLVIAYEKQESGFYYTKILSEDEIDNKQSNKNNVVIRSVIINKSEKTHSNQLANRQYFFDLKVLNKEKSDLIKKIGFSTFFELYINQSIEKILYCENL